jgi:tripartite-type tricarboxylate transporter receptor subunit TctC
MRNTALMRRHFLALAGAATVLPRAFANTPVHLVVPFGPGAIADTLARAIQQELGAQLDAPVLVENRPGAGGTVGTAYVAKAARDGHKLILAAASHTLAPHLYPNLPYDPLRDFMPVAHLGNFGYVIAVPATLGVSDLAGYLRLLRARPGEFNYASAGIGSASHLGMAYFLATAGAKMEHIPMKSTGDAVNELLAGRAHAVMSALTGLVGFRDDKRLVFLGYTGAQRSKTVPDTPSVSEAALPGFVFESWNGVLAPAGVPQGELAGLSGAMMRVLGDPAVQERLARLGVETAPLPLDEFRALLRRDWELAGAIVQASGAHLK